MTRPLILRPLALPIVTTTAATAPGGPVTNVTTLQPREAAVWTAGGVVDVTVDLGTAATVSALALVATDASVWELRAADTLPGLDTAPVIASGAAAATGEGVAAIWWGTATTKRWWRVNLTLPPGGGSLGRLVLAEAFAPLWPYQWGMVRAHTAPQIQETPGGAIYPRRRLPRRRWQVSWGDITDAEWSAQWAALTGYLAGAGEIVFCADYDAADPAKESIYALASLPQGTLRWRPNRWRAAMLFEELL